MRVVLATDNHKTVNPANLDKRKDGAEGVLRVASDNALEIGRALLQSLLDCEVQRLVGSEADESLPLTPENLVNSR